MLSTSYPHLLEWGVGMGKGAKPECLAFFRGGWGLAGLCKDHLEISRDLSLLIFFNNNVATEK